MSGIHGRYLGDLYKVRCWANDKFILLIVMDGIIRHNILQPDI